MMAQQIKNSPTMQETQEMHVQSLGQEDLLEKEMATHSCILAWKIPWTEEPGKLHGVAKELDTTEQLSARIRACRHLPLSYSIPKMVAISGSRKGGTVQS